MQDGTGSRFVLNNTGDEKLAVAQAIELSLSVMFASNSSILHLVRVMQPAAFEFDFLTF